MFEWLKTRRLCEGQVIVHWPLTDVREDVLVVDLSRLNENVVGVKRRTYGVMLRVQPPPYPEEVEYVGMDAI